MKIYNFDIRQKRGNNLTMDKKDILILIETNPDNDIFFNDWIDRGYKANVLFKKINKPLRAIRRLCLMNNLVGTKSWLNNWFNNLNEYKAIIIHMSYLTRYLPFYINKKYPDLKIICWYWNTIDDKTLPIKTEIKNIEYYSFDKNDCEKYGLKYNIQYYCEPKQLVKDNIDDDIYFVGRSKGREEKIESFKEHALKENLKCKFVVINNSNELLPYSSIKKELLKTKAVLEINKKNQVGFTLRALESLFYEIKLITDNKEIKNSPIYCKDNVFIIDEDDYDDLYDFINKPYNHLYSYHHIEIRK